MMDDLEMSPLRLKMRIYNNCLVARREALGLSQAALAKAVGISFGLYNALECLRIKPVTSSGAWRLIVQDIATFHRCMPEDLFPEVVQAVEKNMVVRCLTAGEVERLLADVPDVPALPTPEDEAMEHEESMILDDVLATLPERVRDVLVLRFGLDGKGERTLVEVGEIQGVGKERIRQLEAKGLRALRARAKRSNG